MPDRDTSEQQPPQPLLTAAEVDTLRECVEGRAALPATCEAFAARGLLQREEGGHYVLTAETRRTLNLSGLWTTASTDEPGARRSET